MRTISEALVLAAQHELSRDVRDPGREDIITTYWDTSGRSWASWIRNKTKRDGYFRGKGGVDWCGMFASYCLSQVGNFIDEKQCIEMQFDPQLRLRVLPSTYRLNSLEKWKEAGYQSIPRVDPSEVKAGDVIILRWAGGPQYGNHIAIAIEDPKGEGVITIEGNARSEDSSHRGVVKRNRKVKDIARAYRFDESHFM